MYMTRRSLSTGGWLMCMVHDVCTVTSPVRVGRPISGSPQLCRAKAGCTSALCDPATTASWPERSSAPVTEIPTMIPQHW